MRRVHSIFALLTDADVDWLARVGTRRRVKQGEMLIERNKPFDAIVVVLEGELLVDMQDLGVLARRGVGEILGEMSLVDSAPPSATVVAEGECLVLLLNKNILQQKLATDLAFGSRFYRALALFVASRLRELQRDLLGPPHGGSAEGAVPAEEFDAMVQVSAERFDRMLKVLTGT